MTKAFPQKRKWHWVVILIVNIARSCWSVSYFWGLDTKKLLYMFCNIAVANYYVNSSPQNIKYAVLTDALDSENDNDLGAVAAKRSMNKISDEVQINLGSKIEQFLWKKTKMNRMGMGMWLITALSETTFVRRKSFLNSTKVLKSLITFCPSSWSSKSVWQLNCIRRVHYIICPFLVTLMVFIPNNSGYRAHLFKEMPTVKKFLFKKERGFLLEYRNCFFGETQKGWWTKVSKIDWSLWIITNEVKTHCHITSPRTNTNDDAAQYFEGGLLGSGIDFQAQKNVSTR